MPEFEKPQVEIKTTDGNVYGVIGAVAKALIKAGQTERAAEFKQKALNSDSYNAVLQLTHDYIDWF